MSRWQEVLCFMIEELINQDRSSFYRDYYMFFFLATDFTDYHGFFFD